MRFTILGSPYSKANSRRLVKFGPRLASIKSDNALGYEKHARLQFAAQMKGQERLEGPVSVAMTIYYPDRRQDLDPSLVLDVMQEHKDKKTGQIIWPGVYKNDRQVVEQHLFRRVDKLNPRAEIVVVPLLVPSVPGVSKSPRR